LASANYLLRRIAALFNEKDGTDDGKRMASNWEVILTPFLRTKSRRTGSDAIAFDAFFQ